jgi:cell envelope opacity-associated protein A
MNDLSTNYPLGNHRRISNPPAIAPEKTGISVYKWINPAVFHTTKKNGNDAAPVATQKITLARTETSYRNLIAALSRNRKMPVERPSAQALLTATLLPGRDHWSLNTHFYSSM